MEGPVEYVFFANRLRRRAFADVSATCIRAGRLLVLLTGLLLAVMPFTEGHWIWDKFLLGGQDMELGLLGIAAVLCLVLVLSQNCRQGVVRMLAIWPFSRFEREPLRIPASAMKAFCGGSAPIPVLATYNIPLQI